MTPTLVGISLDFVIPMPCETSCPHVTTASLAAPTMTTALATRVTTQVASVCTSIRGITTKTTTLACRRMTTPLCLRLALPRELVVVPVPAGGQDTQLEQLREIQAKLDKEAGRLVQLRQNIEQEWAGWALAGGARHRARDVQRRIVDDARAGLPPAFSGVGQNLATAAMLLRTMPEPSTTEGRRIQGELKELLEDAAVRRAESSASRRRGCPSEHPATPPPPDACGRPRPTPSAHRTGRLQPRTASAAESRLEGG
jgi:hypothetical protein